MPLAERKLIERIAQSSRAQGSSKLIVQGIGDDCAVLRVPEGHQTLVTTDFSLEGVHFRREWHPADAVGHRCLIRGLSDIAAMGGEPLAAFLSLALPAELPQRWADGFLKGMLALARRFGVTLAGGDIAQSPAGVLADITVVGSVPARSGDPAFRSAAWRQYFCDRRIGGASGSAGADVCQSETQVSGGRFSRSFLSRTTDRGGAPTADARSWRRR